MRESKCFNFEGAFLYLLFGNARAILLNTGSAPGPAAEGQILPIRRTVDEIVEQARLEGDAADVELIVSHTHGHEDHVFWHGDFRNRPRTAVIGLSLTDIKAFFNLPDWPDGEARLDLGGRLLTVFPLPGHEATHVAVYDHQTRFLFTGDTLYPGVLTVRDWPAYRRSAARMAAFSEAHDVALVLGDHIEMKKTPGEFFPIGTTFQPDEHVLPLTAAHIRKLHNACEAMGDAPHDDVHDDFIIRIL